MDRFTWTHSIWIPGKHALKHEPGKYSVRVTIAPAREIEPVWQALAEELSGEESVVYDGGATLRLVGGVIEVASSGEDVLESIGYAINETLAATVESFAPDARIVVVGEGKKLTKW